MMISHWITVNNQTPLCFINKKKMVQSVLFWTEQENPNVISPLDVAKSCVVYSSVKALKEFGIHCLAETKSEAAGLTIED